MSYASMYGYGYNPRKTYENQLENYQNNLDTYRSNLEEYKTAKTELEKVKRQYDIEFRNSYSYPNKIIAQDPLGL
jgi:uncharacterized membrane-anchored protein YhcB (DUF1043 family)